MGGLPPFAGALSNGEVAPETAVRVLDRVCADWQERPSLANRLVAGTACRLRGCERSASRGVGGRVQGLAGLLGVFDVVGVAAWAFSGTFTILVVVPRLSNSMWTK